MTKKLTLDHAIELAKKKGGACLSDKYVYSKHKLLWQCSCGYTWKAPITSIKRGHWCSKCCVKRSTKFKLNDVEKYIKNKKGELLTSEYHKTVDQIKIKCELGHIWTPCFAEILKGSWCPECVRTKYTIEDCQKIANEHYGKCLSTELVRTKSKIVWECEYGHIWKATLGNVKDNGSWCPECFQSYGERKFREKIENITNYKFPKIRPEWLLNSRGNRMEIDGFCKELNIGFEYQGRQHFDFIPYWHKKIEKYKFQIESDILKKQVLQNRSIKMLHPHFKLTPINFETFIRSQIYGE